MVVGWLVEVVDDAATAVVEVVDVEPGAGVEVVAARLVVGVAGLVVGTAGLVVVATLLLGATVVGGSRAVDEGAVAEGSGSGGNVAGVTGSAPTSADDNGRTGRSETCSPARFTALHATMAVRNVAPTQAAMIPSLFMAPLSPTRVLRLHNNSLAVG